MQRKVNEAAMIFLIGVSPLAFELVKENLDRLSFIQKAQSDFDAESEKQLNLFKRRYYDVKQLMEKEQKTKVHPKFDLRIETLKKWKSTTMEQNLAGNLAVVGIHVVGSFFASTPFFLSIVGYFALYQMNFMNDLFILKGKSAFFEQSKFSFQKINTAYMYLGGVGLLLAGFNKGIARLTKNITNDNFK